MTTTTITAFWEGITSSTQSLILGNNTFWITLAQAVLIIIVISSLFLVITKAIKTAIRGRKKRIR